MGFWAQRGGFVRSTDLAGPRSVGTILVYLSVSLSGCQQLNPKFGFGNGESESLSTQGDPAVESATFPHGNGGAASLGSEVKDTGFVQTGGANASSGQVPAASSAMDSTTTQSSPVDPTTTDSTQDDSSSSTETPWDYCDAPALVCLNMNDPSRPELEKDAYVFNTGNNASYAIYDGSDKAWPGLTWLGVKGIDPVRSDKSVAISTVQGKDEDQLGFDVWLRHEADLKAEVFVELEDMMAVGRGDGRIRCSKFNDDLYAAHVDPLSGFHDPWLTTSFPLQNAGQWQHVACYARGKDFGIWYLGAANENKDVGLTIPEHYMNARTQAKVILGNSDWLTATKRYGVSTSSPEIAALRIWTNVDTMLSILNQEHQAAQNP